MASNFLFLAHATATSSPVRHSLSIPISNRKKLTDSQQSTAALWINRTTLILLILTALLTLSTFTHLAPAVQFTFVILNGIAQAAAGAYMQTAGVVVASLFGSWAMQTMMAGNAAVAVVVSTVQAVAAAASVWGLPDDMIASYKIDSSAEERAAFIFFGLSTLFLAGALFANQWFFATPAYRALVMPPAHKYEGESQGDSEEHEGLVSGSGGREVVQSDKALKIMRVAKANVIYEIAVAFVFIVTLVSYSTYAFCEISPHTPVRVSSNNSNREANEPSHSPASVQRHSLPHLQHW